MNVPANLRRSEKEPYLFFDSDVLPRGNKDFFCTIGGYDRHPCPDETATLDYRLLPEYSSVEKVPYWHLIKSVFASEGNPLQMGNLTNPDGWLARHKRKGRG